MFKIDKVTHFLYTVKMQRVYHRNSEKLGLNKCYGRLSLYECGFNMSRKIGWAGNYPLLCKGNFLQPNSRYQDTNTKYSFIHSFIHSFIPISALRVWWIRLASLMWFTISILSLLNFLIRMVTGCLKPTRVYH